MRKIFIILIVLVTTTTAWGQRFKSGDLYYNITSPYTVEVTYKNDSYGKNYKLDTVVIPSTVTKGKTTYKVTNIGENAFYYCGGLRSITIPEKIVGIGHDAFRGCGLLSTLIIPHGVKSIGKNAFYGCSALRSISIPESVTSIGTRAFSDCKSLNAITIGKSVKSIGSHAFDNCIKLTSLTLSTVDFINDYNLCHIFGTQITRCELIDEVKIIKPNLFMSCLNLETVVIGENVTTIGAHAFEDCKSLKSINIPNSVTDIGAYAFKNCSSLNNVSIPISVTTIGAAAFANCVSLESIHIPNKVTKINASMFDGCSSLTSVTIPESVTRIEKNAFYKCSSLDSIIIPNSVISIGESAFCRCSSLTSVTIPNNVTSLENYVFNQCTNLKNVYLGYGVTRIGENVFYKCNSLVSIDIPVSVESIGNGTFWDCSKLESVNIPYRVTSIGEYTFKGCTSLIHIDIPNSVESIGEHAFENCRSLVSVTIGKSVKSIGTRAFSDCSALSSISLPESMTTIGYAAFDGCKFLTSIYIPKGMKSIGYDAFSHLKHVEYGGTEDMWKTMGGVKGEHGITVNYNKSVQPKAQPNQAPRPTLQQPLLTLVENSLRFVDVSQNNCIEANEQSHICFRVRNFGKGTATNCEARIRMSGNCNGISVQTLKLPKIAPGTEQEVRMPIKSDINTKDGRVTFTIEVHEHSGFGVAPFNLTVATKAYVAPYMQITDHHITSASGKVQRMVPFTLTFNLQNTQYGDAEDVKVEVKYPSNVIVVEGNEQNSFSKIKSGETRTIQLSLLANNYAANTLPITIDVKEKYGKYAENKQISVAISQSATTNVTIASTTATEQPRAEIQIGSLLSEVDRNIPKTKNHNPYTFVVILANENYNYVATVPYALNDGKIFYQYCQHTLGIPEENIKLYTDATYNEIRLAMSWLENVCRAYQGDAEVIFYYAGHGIPDTHDRASYLLPTDGDGRYVSTAYKLDELYHTLGDMPAKSVVVMMDACFSGANRNDQMLASERGVKLVSRPGMPKGNMVILSAAQGDQTALPNDKEKHGMFTYFLLKKLQETNGDVTLGELSEYIITEVQRRSAVINKLQTPTVNASPAITDEWHRWKL